MNRLLILHTAAAFLLLPHGRLHAAGTELSETLQLPGYHSLGWHSKRDGHLPTH